MNIGLRAPGIFAILIVAAAGTSCKRSTESRAAAESKALPAPPFDVEPNTGRVTDEEVRRAVEDQLENDPMLRPGAVQVASSEGVVSLTGTVDNLLAKDSATRISEAVVGVRSVSNRIQVDAPARSDEQLENAVNRAFLFNAAADRYELGVDAIEGGVVLTGTVQSFHERALAERLAKGVPGVREVHNNVAIELAPRADAEIEADIESRLYWDVLVDGAGLDVQVDDGKVRLNGFVGSAAERTRAHLDAWVRGVTAVDSADVEIRWWVNEQDLRRGKYSKKTDVEVAGALRDAIVEDPRVNAVGLEISITDGRARLSGAVDSAKAKAAAEAVARHTVGVMDVDNGLRVAPVRAPSDAHVRTQIEGALLLNPLTHSHQIETEVREGTVTLTGTVANYFASGEAEEVASSVRGVKVVDNKLEVASPRIGYVYHGYVDPYGSYRYEPSSVMSETARPDEAIAAEIEQELRWSPFVDADQVTVTVVDGKATLTGTVDTWRERRSATENALEGGATAVDNQLHVG